MLELQVGDAVVFAYYQPPDAGPDVGGYLGRVRAGGQFKGLDFDQLRYLGSGRHDVILDERRRDRPGAEPEYRSEHDRLFERFRFSLFMYSVGACAAHVVLSSACEVIRLESPCDPV